MALTTIRIVALTVRISTIERTTVIMNDAGLAGRASFGRVGVTFVLVVASLGLIFLLMVIILSFY